MRLQYRDLLEPVGNPTLGEIVRREFNKDSIAGENLDVVLSNLAADVGEDDVTVRQFNPELRIGQRLGHDTFDFDSLFLCQTGTLPNENVIVLTLPHPAALDSESHVREGE